jgi:hypothetical protein
MTIDYAKAYNQERLALADRKRLMRQVMHNQRDGRGTSYSLLRARARRRLTRILWKRAEPTSPVSSSV